jgi:hypothetical protein
MPSLASMKKASDEVKLNAKKTRKRRFLEEMEFVVPWAELVALIKPYYPEGRIGRPLLRWRRCCARISCSSGLACRTRRWKRPSRTCRCTASAESRKRGFSAIQDVYANGMSAMAAPVCKRGEQTTGVLIVAGPSLRLTMEGMLGFGPALVEAAGELAMTGNASPLLRAANVGTWGNLAS